MRSIASTQNSTLLPFYIEFAYMYVFDDTRVILKHSDDCQRVSDALHDCSLFSGLFWGPDEVHMAALSFETYAGQLTTLLASFSMTSSPRGLACRELEAM